MLKEKKNDLISPSTHSKWMRKSLLLRHCILTPRRLPRHQNTPISAAGYIQQYWSIRKNLKEWFVHMSIGRNHCPHSWNEIRPVQHFDQCMASFTFAWLLSKVLCSIMSTLYVSHTVILLRLNRPFFHTAIYILWCLKWNSGHLTARLPPTYCCSVQSSFILDMVGIDLGLGDNVTSVHILQVTSSVATQWLKRNAERPGGIEILQKVTPAQCDSIVLWDSDIQHSVVLRREKCDIA